MFITIAWALSPDFMPLIPDDGPVFKNRKTCPHRFLGAMVSEAIIAMVWATVGLAFYKEGPPPWQPLWQMADPMRLSNILHGPDGNWREGYGHSGCDCLPYYHGDTAFRAARLLLAESLIWTKRKPHADFTWQSLVCSGLCHDLYRFWDTLEIFRLEQSGSGDRYSLVMLRLLYKYKGQHHWITTLPPCL